MFGEIEYKVIDEVKFGPEDNPGTWLRLEETAKGTRVIRSWSGAGKNHYWKIMYRYDVDNQWKQWKKQCQRTRLRT